MDVLTRLSSDSVFRLHAAASLLAFRSQFSTPVSSILLNFVPNISYRYQLGRINYWIGDNTKLLLAIYHASYFGARTARVTPIIPLSGNICVVSVSKLSTLAGDGRAIGSGISNIDTQIDILKFSANRVRCTELFVVG